MPASIASLAREGKNAPEMRNTPTPKKRRMTMKTVLATRAQTSLKLLLAVAITTCGFTAAANAQPSYVGKFTLTHEVHWGKAVLPAGQYFIRVDSTSAPAKISSMSGSQAMVYTELPTIADSEKGGTYLTITTQGHESRVRSLNEPGLGKLVIFAPLTKSEREILAKAGQIQTVPVIVARK
jgi:hypothetical protein